MLYAIDSITKSKIEVVSKEDMNTYIEQQVTSILSCSVKGIIKYPNFVK